MDEYQHDIIHEISDLGIPTHKRIYGGKKMLLKYKNIQYRVKSARIRKPPVRYQA